MEFVEGAAYVSPTRNKSYIFRTLSLVRGFLCTGPYLDSEFVTEEEAPDDLVCIWKPGDVVHPIPPFHKRRTWGVLEGVSGVFVTNTEVQNEPATEPPVELEVDPDAPDDPTDHISLKWYTTPHGNRREVDPNTAEADLPRTLYADLGPRKDTIVKNLTGPVSDIPQQEIGYTDVVREELTWEKKDNLPLAVRWIGDHDE